MHSVASSSTRRRYPLPDENSKRTRVDPVFGWLEAHGGDAWGARLLGLAKGLDVEINPGQVVSTKLEFGVAASDERLAWLLEHAEALGHQGSKLEEIMRRIASGERKLQVLEGTTYADCLVECQHAIIWIEGKRHDWLSPSTTWDPQRDQLARNVEGAWLTALEQEKEEFCVLLCHETDLSADDQALVEGYRSSELTAGLPHVDQESRLQFAKRIGTVTWAEIVNAWPQLRDDPVLADC